MSDHEFERKVQISMEQLRLRPSDTVWAEVEKTIRKDKRRRRIVMWLPICLLFIGAGGYFMLQGDRQPQQHVAAQTTVPATSSNPSTTNTNSVSDNNSTRKDSNRTSTITETPAAKQPETEKATKTTPAATEDERASQTLTFEFETVRKKKPATKAPQTNIEIQRNKPVRTTKGKDKPAANQDIAASSNTTTNQPGNTEAGKDVASNTTTDNNVVIDSALAQLTPDTATTVTTTVIIDSASLANSTSADSVQKAAELVKQPAVQPMAATKIPLPLQRPQTGRWQWGVQIEGGYAGITEDGLLGGLFGFLKTTETSKVADLTMASNVSYNNGLSTAYAPQFPRPVNKPSTITMGPSFAVGGYIQRVLSKRFSLSVGLQYAYQSVRTVVGEKVNNTRTVNRAPSTAQVVRYYYDANNTENYTNQYHFIEIPVTLHTKLNRSLRMPFVWDLGFSAARMLSTNALHYDGLGGVYYKDNNLFNKTQWVIGTGFNIGLFQKGRHPLSVGPSVRYNMSNLLTKDYTTGQHLWSVGLKASMLLKK